MLRLGLLLALLGAVGCSSSGSASTTGGGSSGTTGATSTGGTTGQHFCQERDAGCGSQADCGESRGSIQVYACESSGCCGLQGSTDASGNSQISLNQVQVQLASNIAGTVNSFELRAFYPFRTTGAAVTCADVVGLPDFADGGNPLDVDATLNFENVGAYPANNSSSGSIFSMNVSLSAGTAPVVLVQAYSAGQVNGHAAGIRYGEGCAVAPTIGTSSQTIDVTANAVQ